MKINLIIDKFLWVIILILMSCSNENELYEALHIHRQLPHIQHPATPEQERRNTIPQDENVDWGRPEIVEMIEDYPHQATVKVVTRKPLSPSLSLVVAQNSRALLDERYQSIKVFLSSPSFNAESKNADNAYFIVEYEDGEVKIKRQMSWLQRFSLWLDDLKG